MTTLNGMQLRMIRAALNESRTEFAHNTGISESVQQSIETEQSVASVKSHEAIVKYVAQKGLEIKEDGSVGKLDNKPVILKGKEGFIEFMGDVYETMKTQGGEICVSNVDEKNWIRWMTQETYDAHAKRMSEIDQDINFKILIKEGDTFFIASSIAEYRWTEKAKWHDQSVYAYGDKLAFIKFGEEDVKVTVIKGKEFSDAFRNLFNFAWEGACIPSSSEAA